MLLKYQRVGPLNQEPAMLAEIYMLRLEAAARATATATTNSRFVPITLPALPHQTSTCVSPTSKPGMTTA